MSKSFRMGGIHPPENKIARATAVARMPLPETVVIPLSQHIGAPAQIAVKKGDTVRAGQLIGTAAGFVSANVHSSVSGTVTSVDAVPDAGGVRRPAVTIKVESDVWDAAIDLSDTLIEECSLSPEEIVRKISDAGIVGMGGATFPTHIKLRNSVECLIINGVECEPWLTADHRLMLERGPEMLAGVRILARALGVARIYIGIENNKPDAIAHLRTLVAPHPEIAIVPLKVKYPQGSEKQLIAAITGRKIPSGGLPVNIGVVVQNVATTLAVYEAVQKNKPLVERIVTVTGPGLDKPANLLVRVGTPIRSLIDFCGGMPDGTGKVIKGGPMMGCAVSNLDGTVTKGTSGILLLPRPEAVRRAPEVCIRCAKCVAACPAGIEPYLLYKFGLHNRFTDMQHHHATDCIECGCCSYICPAALPLLDYIRLGKVEVMKMMRAGI